ncbi:hypothetical protein X275_08250 [Marinitoga sp. 1197]|uniref:hypothetical protein n=1 Tax=Marinitoga sp. 1197 TaxID=1428449 RepID=UPI000640E5CB|nr:hypothetical protein [Marinitoga sp. 1197]KLO21826.1 hypothetical protein X275_08250 [Marinitoga sp. 1197]
MRLRQMRINRLRFTPGKIKKPPKSIGMRRLGIMPHKPRPRPRPKPTIHKKINKIGMRKPGIVKPIKVSHVKKIKQAKKTIPISWSPFDFFKGAANLVGGVVGGVTKTIGGVVGSVLRPKHKTKPKPKPRPKPKPVKRVIRRTYTPKSTPVLTPRKTVKPIRQIRKPVKKLQIAAEVDPTNGRTRDTSRYTRTTVKTRTENKKSFLPIVLVGAAAVGGFLLLRK